MTKSKFPKAFAAVGLATVLVGCGSGSSTVEIMSNDSSEDTTGNMEDTAMTPPAPSTPSPAAPGPMATAKAAAENVRETVTNLVQGLGNYSTDTAFANAEKVLSEFQDLVSKDTDILPEDKIALLEAYEQLQIDFDTRKEMKENLTTKNELVTRWIAALDAWGGNAIDMNSIDLSLDQTGIEDLMYSDVIDPDEKDASTRIAYRTGPESFATDAVLEGGTMIKDLPEGWEGKSFRINSSGQHIKIFTDRMSGTPYMYSSLSSETESNWEGFWGTDNNSITDSGAATTAQAISTVEGANNQAANGPGMARYFEQGYHEYAFGGSNVDILRGAKSTADTVEDDVQKEIIRIKEGESSAIHYTDLSIDGIDLVMRREDMLNIGITNGLDEDARLFGQTVMLGCSVLNGDGGAETGNDAGGCGVSLDSEGFLMITQASINGAGEAITTEIDDDHTAYLTLTTEQTRADLASETVSLKRPDAEYTVMGYWITGEPARNEYAIDTFATARYGPKNNMITDKVARLVGTAEYSGSALGVYVMNKGDESNKDLYKGDFKAEVSLTANFGRDTYATNTSGKDAFTVTGTIQSFDSLMHNEHDLSTWNLNLEESTVNNSNGSFSGATSGGGKWQGEFYGNSGIETTTERDDHPLAAVGDFSGDFGNSNRVVGVFSAEKMEE